MGDGEAIVDGCCAYMEGYLGEMGGLARSAEPRLLAGRLVVLLGIGGNTAISAHRHTVRWGFENRPADQVDRSSGSGQAAGRLQPTLTATCCFFFQMLRRANCASEVATELQYQVAPVSGAQAEAI